MTEERRRPSDSEFVMPSMRLDGRVALVTGGSRGLGIGLALALAHAGADLAIAARTEAEIAQACTLIEAQTGRRTFSVPTDVGNVEAVRAMVERTHTHFGRLDILVNAAGINIRQPHDQFTEADWDRLLNINLKGAFFAAQAAARLMRQQRKGKIINITSLTTQVALPNVAPYSISKSGLQQMTRALALELAPHGIHVNAIGPGRFWTAMTDKLFSDPAIYDGNVSMIPLGRPGVATDLAGAVLLLASDASDYITGQTIFVDGGWLANGGVKA
jgi:NAD(P)-dependent dehydrogenase (short-subunit alcohol dehydrogenase family)